MLNSNAGTLILPSNDNQRIEIKFYRCSLNEANYSYFQNIFDFYNLYENNNVNLVFYYSIAITEVKTTSRHLSWL